MENETVTGQDPGQMNADDLARGNVKRGIGPNREMKNVPFSEEGIQELLGERFQVKPSLQGNYQVNIRNMRSTSDDDKITLLYEARQLLIQKGFQATAKLTFRSQRTNRFENWPCIWVDQTPENSEIHRANAILQRLVSKLRAAGVELDDEDEVEVSDSFPEDREIEPTDEDREQQAKILANQRDVAQGKSRKNTPAMEREPTLGNTSSSVESRGGPRKHK